MRGLDEEPHGVLHQFLFQIVASLQENIPNLPAIIKFVPDLFAMALETPDLPSQNQFSPKGYGTIYTGIDAGHTREDILLSM